jgi:hypothetical protein
MNASNGLRWLTLALSSGRYGTSFLGTNADLVRDYFTEADDGTISRGASHHPRHLASDLTELVERGILVRERVKHGYRYSFRY